MRHTGGIIVIYSAEYCDFVIMEDSDEFTALEMDEILKRLFMLKDRVPIIDFLNRLYNDNLSYNAAITYGNTEIINEKTNKRRSKRKKSLYKKSYIKFHADLYLSVKDNNEVYEYALEFQTVYDKEIAIRIFRYSFERAVALDYYRDKNRIIIDFPEPYLLLIEEEDVGDSLTLEIRVPKKEPYELDIKLLKYWNYDLSQLYEENMYFLYPLQIFKLRKAMEEVYRRNDSEKEIMLQELHENLLEVADNSVRAIDKAYENGKIDLGTYNEMIKVLSNINAYLVDIYKLPEEYEEEVKVLVKTFYDPKVEERGIEKGIKIGEQTGEQRAALRTKREDIIELLEDIGNVSNEIKELIEKEENFDVLKKWLKIAAKAGSIDEFMDRVRVH